MHDLERIAGIRQSRIVRLRRAERNAVTMCEQNRNAVSEAYDAVAAYKKEIESLEFDLLTELVEKEITTQAIYRLEKALKNAEDKARVLAHNLSLAREALQAAEKELDGARRKRREAQNNQERLTQLADQLKERAMLQDRAIDERMLDETVDMLTAMRWICHDRSA
ncbi:hypothetical protein [uncultured Roseibium sp.]|uniref:hypothetical protein n=1 Tax=uncultured Roseibium sp. TaxID=1936171 RepID=UPI00262CA4FD|nr:hypothetical protein [uncultured Roseibium sp.]